MIKNECKIVRDLFPNYIENEVSNETKEFVNGHLKNCKECNNILKDISKSEIKKEKIEEKDEIDFLKKYNEKILIAKGIIIILMIVILSSLGIVTFKYTTRYIKGKRAHDIITEVHNKTEEFKKLNNFVLEIDKPSLKTTYSYKDSYLKEDHDTKGRGYPFPVEPGQTRHYGEITYGRVGDFKDSLFPENRYVGVRWNYDINHNIIKNTSGTLMGLYKSDEFYVIDKIYNKKIIECANIKVTENNEWYILEEYYGDDRIKELYISKEDMLLKKCIQILEGTDVLDTSTYTYTVGTLKDEDVKLTDVEKYQNEESMQFKGYRNIWDCYLKK